MNAQEFMQTHADNAVAGKESAQFGVSRRRFTGAGAQIRIAFDGETGNGNVLALAADNKRAQFLAFTGAQDVARLTQDSEANHARPQDNGVFQFQNAAGQRHGALPLGDGLKELFRGRSAATG